MPNILACRRCRQRKTRCDRAQPSCRNCQLSGRECTYDSRRRRTKLRSPRRTMTDAIADLEQRVASLEQSRQSDNSHTPLSDAYSTPNSAAVSISADTDINPLSRPNCPLTCTVMEAVQLADAFLHDRFSPVVQQRINEMLSIYRRTMETEHTSRIHPPLPLLTDIDGLSLTQEKAEKFVESYFREFSVFVTEDILDREFILMIPKLTGRPYVALSISCQIVYHAILYYSCRVDESDPKQGPLDEDLLLKILYLAHLWENENDAQVTAMDLGAAFLLSDIALQNWDVDKSWSYFSQACNYAETLGYFALDQDHIADGCQNIDSSNGKRIQDDKRHMFWQLVQMNCYYHQNFGKPLIVRLAKSAVRFPAFLQAEPGDFNQNTKQLYTIVGLRITFVTLQLIWNRESRDEGQGTSLVDVVTQLQEEVNKIICDWDLWSRLQGAQNETQQWILVELLLQCYFTIIFLDEMLAESQNPMGVPQKEIGTPRKSLNAARAYFEIVRIIAADDDEPPWWASGPFTSQLLKSMLVLYRNILATADTTTAEQDLSILAWFSQKARCWANRRPRFAPLVTAISALAELGHSLTSAEMLDTRIHQQTSGGS